LTHWEVWTIIEGDSTGVVGNTFGEQTTLGGDTMRWTLRIVTLFAFAFTMAGVSALAADPKTPKTKVSQETCIGAAMLKQPGTIKRIELKSEKGTPIYEFAVESTDGKRWDVECDANTGKIVEVEQEVRSANDPLFKAKRKISEKEARKIALKAYPGEIKQVEYEIEENGDASYEFAITTKDGKKVKVEVDASSGKIVEVSEALD
jgi:uncharacterized membrane protein YkoI